ncbi:TnsA endonuclease N-terminal domain-containing protein [Nostoc sp. GT001]|uniref:TnsA endonuclease N-terminal domain-containing protein n=1 Tax=Nostoc sp. GT001 TaxID=3056647 RepID=UPI0025AB21C0|nr:TnsA endonuclease N-terminal domain-containing protein [Nostoc sp. GT001]MDM9581985.1 DDE-type integrase/transposase/recombinase [Nostoc sp. GT001]
MLTQEEFELWRHRQNLTEAAIKVVEQIRSSQPSRLVGGGKKNVAGRYPSHKMGVTIQFESHKVELPYIYQLEYDDEVLEYYDQPPPIKISYQANNGRNLSFFYTPDFFVLKNNSVGWVECKTENKLQKLAEESRNRYALGEDNQWHTPPGEHYAGQFGFFFRVWSDAEINWVLQRNLNFLEDYYHAECPLVEKSAILAVLSVISAQPGITLAALLHLAEGTTSDDIYSLIATNQIYVDLTAAPLVEPERCFVFRNEQTAFAYRSIILTKTTANDISSPVINIVPGSSVIYDGNILTIVLVGETSILLHTKESQAVELGLTTFENLVREGKITDFRNKVECSLSNEIKEILLKASEQDLKDANLRYSIIEPWLRGQPIEDNKIPKRTFRYWKAKYLQAQQKYGYGYIGLLSFNNLKGNQNRKLPEDIIQQMQNFIKENYENHKQKSKLAVYDAFKTALSAAGVTDDLIPSYKTLIKEINKRSGYEQTVKRSGSRSAYSQEAFYWELELTTPRHGDRPFEIGHIDHTLVDIELRCSRTAKVLGRPWITFLVDAYTRRILAVYITFDPPSYRSCMMVLRICVQRYSRLPQIIVSDNGREFHSTYYQTLIALCDHTLKYRSPSKARFNAVGERLFGTAMTQLVYNLAGNTQITKKVRLMTKSVNPKNLALWTLDLFYHYLCEWAYEIYDTREHPALGQTPREAYTDGMAQFGIRSHRMISYGESFKLLTMPTTDKGKAKVDPSQGLQIRHIHYWSNAFRDPEIQKTYVNVRYDPFDVGIAYAYVQGQWVECISEQYSIFKGRSEKEIEIATAELRKRHQNHAKQFNVRGRHLASFLSTVEAEEVLLEQRLRDSQVKNVFRVIDGGSPNHIPFAQSKENESSHTKESKDWEPPSPENISVNVNKLEIYSEY